MWLILIILAGFWWSKSQQPQIGGAVQPGPAKVLSPISDILAKLLGTPPIVRAVPGNNLLGAPLHINNPIYQYQVSGPTAIRPALMPVSASGGSPSGGGAGTGSGGSGYTPNQPTHGYQIL